MNRADFNNIIHDTRTVDRQTIGEIRELLDLFPYFQSAHMLLLKGLNNTSDIKFENQLKKSAIYVADREVLYHLINDSQTSAVITESEKTVNSETRDFTDNQQTQGLPRSLLISEESDEDDSVNIVFLLDDEQEHIEDTVIFRDPAIFVGGQDDLLELDSREVISEFPETVGVINPEPEAVEKPSKKQVQADLIDKFIVANPRIEPIRDRSDHPIEDKSNQFSEEKGGFITETLAKIYVSQGYYSKAIDIYEKLSLKFPEKSSYFAAQIEKVKGLIK